jgi:cyclase
MPFCYGGGITTVEQAKQIIKLGAEKLAISSAAVNNFSLLSEIGKAVGMQSVVVVIDAKKRNFMSSGDYDVYIKNGKVKTLLKIRDFLTDLNKIGVGEIVVNSIDADGTMSGYDYALAEMARELTDVPITILGGAGSYDDIKKLINKFKIIGAAAGSLFVFKGKYRAVLISYPSKEEKELIS